MTRVSLGLVASLLTLLLMPSAYASLNEPGAFAQESPTFYRSVRGLGMGNAMISIQGGSHSPYYNPAGLNDVEENRFVIMNPTVEIAENSISVIRDAFDLVDAIDAASSDAEKISALNNFIDPYFGEFNHVRAAINVFSWYRKNFSVGLIVEQRTTFSFRDQSLTKFDFKNITDGTLYISGAWGFWGKLLQVGVTAKPSVRSSANERINVATALANEVDDVFQTLLFPHFGIGFDLGVKSDLQIPGLMGLDWYRQFIDYFRPALGVTWQDIGNTVYKTAIRSTDGNESGVEDPAKFAAAVSSQAVRNNQSVSVGVSVNPDILFMKTIFSADFRDLNLDGSVVSKTHFGAEVKFPVIFSARLGVSQGYFAAGVGGDFKIFKLDLATYMEENGVFSSQSGNRRFAVSFGFDF